MEWALHFQGAYKKGPDRGPNPVPGFTEKGEDMSRKSWLAVPLALVLGAGLAGCRVEQTEEGKLPEVDVDVKAKEGNLPKYDVDTPEVTVKTEKREVEVPKDVDISYPEDDAKPAPTPPPQ